LDVILHSRGSEEPLRRRRFHVWLEDLTTPDIGIQRISGIDKAMLFQRYRRIQAVDFAGER
jgi:hypothetical protein